MDDLYKDIEDQEADYEMADEAMRNTYRFVMSGYKWDDLPECFWLLEDPEGTQAIESLITFFEETEEYEKCAKLIEVLKKRN